MSILNNLPIWEKSVWGFLFLCFFGGFFRIQKKATAHFDVRCCLAPRRVEMQIRSYLHLPFQSSSSLQDSNKCHGMD